MEWWGKVMFVFGVIFIIGIGVIVGLIINSFRNWPDRYNKRGRS